MKEERARILYFIRNPSTGFVKIGITDNLKQRIEHLQLASGIELETLAYVPGAAAHERDVHLVFRHSRGIGEWFSVTTELSALIEIAKKAQDIEPIRKWVYRNLGRTVEARQRSHSRAATERFIEKIKGMKGVAA